MQKGRGGEAGKGTTTKKSRSGNRPGKKAFTTGRRFGEDESEGVQADGLAWFGFGLVMAGGQRNGEGEEK